MKKNNKALMIEKAYAAMQNAYSPYSKFKVGTCVEAEDGSLYTGCNVENASYGLTICSEVNAISNLIGAGRKRIKSLLVMGSGKGLCTPCGACRQIIGEFASSNTPIYLADSHQKKIIKTKKFKELLPMAFTPHHIK